MVITSHRQALSPFCSAGVDDFLTVTRGHASAKAVCSLALEYAGLKCALHGFDARPEREPDSKEQHKECQFSNQFIGL